MSPRRAPDDAVVARWEAPPRRHTGQSRATSQTSAFLDALAAHPDEWGVWPKVFAKQASASSVGRQLRIAGKQRGLTVEATTRARRDPETGLLLGDRTAELYARVTTAVARAKRKKKKEPEPEPVLPRVEPDRERVTKAGNHYAQCRDCGTSWLTSVSEEILRQHERILHDDQPTIVLGTPHVEAATS